MLVPTYDIVDCGPRNRFVANGKLVHNSGRLNQQNLGRASRLRSAIHAPHGYALVVADLSNIELRTNMTMSNEVVLRDKLAAGEDLYSLFASQLYNRTVTKADKVERQVGKVAELSLGYAAGDATFRQMLFAQADMTVPMSFASQVVQTYRMGKPVLGVSWNNFKTWIDAMCMGSTIQSWLDAPVELHKDGMLLHGGFKIKYPDMRREAVTDNDGSVQYKARFQRYTGKSSGGRCSLWHGMVNENCVSGDAEVLTFSRGWVRLDSVSPSDAVWDGAEFVAHDGVSYNGDQETICFSNIDMTPDHLVWDGEWTEAQHADEEAARSEARTQYQRSHRPDVGDPHDSAAVTVYEIQVDAVGNALLLVREDQPYRGGRMVENSAPWDTLPVPATHVRNAWNVGDSPILGVSVDGGPVSTTDAPGVAQLWWQGDIRGPSVGHVRGVLTRHGPGIHARVGFGPAGQRRPIFTGELPVGNTGRQLREQTEQSLDGVGGGQSVRAPRVSEKKIPIQHSVLPARSRSYRRSGVRAVYDIVNCGPRNRFVARPSGGGEAIIVHNCCQALARIVLADMQDNVASQTGVLPVLQVHDELIYCVPEAVAEGLLESVLAEMHARRPWWPNLPLAAEGGIGYRYGEIK